MKTPKPEFNKTISLKQYLWDYRDSLAGRQKSRCQAAYSQLQVFLGNEFQLPNEKLLYDLPNRFRRFLREQGFAEESVSNYSKWIGRAIKWIYATHPRLECLQSEGTPLPNLAPDPDDQQHRYYKGYQRYKKWLNSQQNSDQKINKQQFRDYQRFLLGNFKYETARSYYSALVTFWKVRSQRWELPLVDLPEMERKGSGHYGLVRKDWPAQVEKDFADFFSFSRMEKTIDDRSAKEFRDRSTEKAYTTVLATYLGYLRNICGEDISHLSLRELIGNESRVLRYISWHKGERSGGRDALTHRQTLERFAIILSEMWQDPLATTLKELASQLDPERKPPRLAETLLPFRALLAGAIRALEDAKHQWNVARKSGSKKRQKDAAVAYHDALLFALLVFRPMREANIIDLIIGKNLLLQPDGHYDLLVPLMEEKGRKTFRIKFPSAIQPYLEEYLSVCRPVLNVNNDQRLFLTRKGRRLTPKLLIDRTTRLGKRYLNIEALNPHFFRTLTVSSYLADHPNEFETMRQLLGHRSLATTLRYYIHIHAMHSSRRAAQFARDTCEEFRKIGLRFTDSANQIADDCPTGRIRCDMRP